MSNTTETQSQAPAQEQELNIWAAIDILCQAVEAAQSKGGVYNLKDAALLSKCVDVARNTLEQVAKAEQKPQAEQTEAAQ